VAAGQPIPARDVETVLGTASATLFAVVNHGNLGTSRSWILQSVPGPREGTRPLGNADVGTNRNLERVKALLQAPRDVHRQQELEAQRLDEAQNARARVEQNRVAEADDSRGLAVAASAPPDEAARMEQQLTELRAQLAKLTAELAKASSPAGDASESKAEE
jgi:hypothetical protein